MHPQTERARDSRRSAVAVIIAPHAQRCSKMLALGCVNRALAAIARLILVVHITAQNCEPTRRNVQDGFALKLFLP